MILFRVGLIILLALMLSGCPAFLLLALPSVGFTVVSEIDCQANHSNTHRCRAEILGEKENE